MGWEEVSPAASEYASHIHKLNYYAFLDVHLGISPLSIHSEKHLRDCVHVGPHTHQGCPAAQPGPGQEELAVDFWVD